MKGERIEITHKAIEPDLQEDFREALRKWSPKSEWVFLSDESTETPKLTDHEMPVSGRNRSLPGVPEDRYSTILDRAWAEWKRVVHISPR